MEYTVLKPVFHAHKIASADPGVLLQIFSTLLFLVVIWLMVLLMKAVVEVKYARSELAYEKTLYQLKLRTSIALALFLLFPFIHALVH
jgi:hypothetical protein